MSSRGSAGSGSAATSISSRRSAGATSAVSSTPIGQTVSPYTRVRGSRLATGAHASVGDMAKLATKRRSRRGGGGGGGGATAGGGATVSLTPLSGARRPPAGNFGSEKSILTSPTSSSGTAPFHDLTLPPAPALLGSPSPGSSTKSSPAVVGIESRASESVGSGSRSGSVGAGGVSSVNNGSIGRGVDANKASKVAAMAAAAAAMTAVRKRGGGGRGGGGVGDGLAGSGSGHGPRSPPLSPDRSLNVVTSREGVGGKVGEGQVGRKAPRKLQPLVSFTPPTPQQSTTELPIGSTAARPSSSGVMKGLGDRGAGVGNVDVWSIERASRGSIGSSRSSAGSRGSGVSRGSSFGSGMASVLSDPSSGDSFDPNAAQGISLGGGFGAAMSVGAGGKVRGGGSGSGSAAAIAASALLRPLMRSSLPSSPLGSPTTTFGSALPPAPDHGLQIPDYGGAGGEAMNASLNSSMNESRGAEESDSAAAAAAAVAAASAVAAVSTVGRRNPSEQGEVVGFVWWVTSWLAALLYLIWAVTPDSLLTSAGFTYFPSKYWAVMCPIWVASVFAWNIVFEFLVSINFYIPRLDSPDTISDPCARPLPTSSAASSVFLASRRADRDYVPAIADFPLADVNKAMYRARPSRLSSSSPAMMSGMIGMPSMPGMLATRRNHRRQSSLPGAGLSAPLHNFSLGFGGVATSLKVGDGSSEGDMAARPVPASAPSSPSRAQRRR